MRSTKNLCHLIWICTVMFGTFSPAWSQFSPAIPLTSYEASGTSYVVAEDIDNDGDMDILFNSPERIAWYENYEDGVFLPKKIITNSLQQARLCVVADIDNDGWKDVVTVAGSNLGWYKNNGNKTFSNFIAMPGTYSYLSALAVGDLDNDGDQDVVAANSTGGLYKLTNSGTGTFTYTSLNSVSGTTSSLILFDIDIDGDADMLLTTTDLSTQSNNRILLYKNNGSGTFAVPVSITPDTYGTYCVSVADLDNDGLPDLMSASRLDRKIAWYKNTGNGTFGPQQVLTTSLNGPRYVRAEDMDQDGDLDIVATAYDAKTLFWFPNLGGGAFGPMQIIDNTVEKITNVITADLDNDGLKEIIVSSDESIKKVLSYKNLDGGTYSTQQLITATPFGFRMVPMDYNQDGLMDYFMADADGNTLWYVRNFGNGLLANPVAFAEIPWINHLMITDHDGDGDLDILFVSESSIGWLENIDGVISSTPQMLTSSQYFALSAVHFDVNNDGAKDVIMSITATNEIALYQKEGSVDYQSAQVINSTLQDVNWLTAMDVNSDGFEDLMLISAYSLKWLPNLGNGTFGPANTLVTPGIDVTVVIAADVNGDGLKDIIIASNARNIYTMLNQGNGVFQNPVQLNISSLYSPQELICDDSDLDGDLDLYAFSDWKDSGYWFENTGGGTFAQPVTIHTANEPNTYSMAHALIEDMDGDGDKDIIVSNGDLDMYWLKNHHFHAGQVKGRTFVDRNANGIHDSTDTGIPMHNMISNPQSDFTFTNSDGKYFMIFSDVSGTYQISPQPIPYWGLSTDSASYQVILNASTSPLDSLDFGFVPDTIIHQLEPKIIGGFPRCNTTINYWLDVRNSGTTIPSGVIRLELDTNLTYVASVQTPDSITGNYIYWHFDSLSYFNAEQWKLSVQVPDFQSMGAVMTSRLTAYVYDSTGALSVSFTDSIRQTVVCAYDPNDKIVEPAGYGPLGLIAMETSSLDYTVRFQNTGNDTAITVRILDQLDPSLRWRSLEILASSDPVTVNGNQDGSVIFEFKNIFLPDSNINELASHGFIHYRLHLEENLPAGTQIRNFASIFFDLNPAVITNETVNTLYECPAGPIQYTFSSAYACSRDFSGTVITPELNKEYTWTINGTQHTGTAFNWTADIAGTYNLQLTATDSLEICAVKYTTQAVTITDGVIGVELQEFAQDTICLQSNAVSLPAGTPSGGTYMGTGITGNTFDPAIAGNGTHSIVYTYTDENDCTSSDTASITVQICLGIYELSAKDINVFPNPFKGTTSIQFPQDPGGEYDLVIYNLLGETVSAKQMLIENPQVIGLHDMGPGVYFLNLIHRNSGSRIIKPLILE